MIANNAKQQPSTQISENKKLYSLKKLFSVQKTSNHNNYKPNKSSTINPNPNPNRSLLLTKHNPLSILKAPKIRKRIYLDEQQQKQLYSAIQSMDQKGFIQIKKINREQKNSILINTKIYHDIIRKIQETKNISRNGKESCLPDIKKGYKIGNNSHNGNNDHDKTHMQSTNINDYQKISNFDVSKITLINPQNQKIENLCKNQQDFKKYKTNQLRSKRHSNIYSVNNQIKINSYKQQLNHDNYKTIIVNMKSKKDSYCNENQFRKDSQNSQKQIVNRNQSYRSQYLQQQFSQTIDQNNAQKYLQSDINNNKKLLPNITLQNSQSQSALSIMASSQKKLAKKSCYMKYHIQARKFLEYNKNNLQIDPKIKDFMITGISASCYFVIDSLTLTPLAYRNFEKKIQIASISKIMTCYLTLLISKKYKIDLKKYQVRVSENAVQINGTSAGLNVGDALSLYELLYGLMLPSGNDASVVIAEAVGKIIQKYKKKQTTKTYYETFIAHMNVLSRELGLEQTWRNSSGLPSYPNYSTPKAVACLASIAMINENFREIVNCQKYQLLIKNQRFGLKRKTIWENTNKLLNDGWQGVKTGQTDSAGACLVAKKGRYIIAVFNSKNSNSRFKQCQQLYNFMKARQRILFPQKWD